MEKFYFINLQKYFNIIDLNKDQVIEKSQLLYIMHKNNKNIDSLSSSVITQIFQEIKNSKDSTHNYITKQEFMTWIEKKKQFLIEKFRQFDFNNNGYIDINDLLKLEQKLNIKIDQQKALKLLYRIDLDHNGQISFNQFFQFYFLLPCQNNIKNMFNHWERNLSIDIGQTSMTIPNQQKLKGKQAIITLISGGIAGAFSRSFTAPLDRLKVIMQANTGNEKLKIIQGIKRIYKQEGLKAYFRGNGTNVIKIMPETAIKFMCYDQIKLLICEDIQDPKTYQRLLSGGCAGFLSQTLIYPLEIAKTRLTLAKPGLYSGIFNCLRKIIKYQGYKSLYSGWGASVIGIIPYASIDLGIYSLLRDQYIKNYLQQPQVGVLLVCGATSSICGQLVSYPLALIRTRLQCQGLPDRKKEYNGLFDCMRTILKKEGFRGLYKGIVPNFMKSCPAIAISYAIFQKCKNLLKMH